MIQLGSGGEECSQEPACSSTKLELLPGYENLFTFLQALLTMQPLKKNKMHKLVSSPVRIIKQKLNVLFHESMNVEKTDLTSVVEGLKP